jgi:hypothetical protein
MVNAVDIPSNAHRHHSPGKDDHESSHQQFERVMATRSYDSKNVDAVRAHVGSYVQYVHYVEGLYNAAGATAAEHAHAPADARAHSD